MKVAVLGYSGGGKSTLAAQLGRRLSCPVLHLDRVQYTADWRERDRSEALEMVERFMAQDAWVIDGNYAGFLQERRLAEADRIVLLLLNRWSCLGRVWRRSRRFRNRTRPDMADGCIERLNPEFLWWVFWAGRTGPKRRRYRRIAAEYPEKTVVLRSQREIDRYWEEMQC